MVGQGRYAKNQQALYRPVERVADFGRRLSVLLSLDEGGDLVEVLELAIRHVVKPSLVQFGLVLFVDHLLALLLGALVEQRYIDLVLAQYHRCQRKCPLGLHLQTHRLAVAGLFGDLLGP